MDLKEISAGARGHNGTVWKLERSEYVNANLARVPAGDSIGERVNEEIDMVMDMIDSLAGVPVGFQIEEGL
ncbi:MAG: hypothetical protein WKF67_11590 [Rubrobacteraceae bacterium]